MSDTHETNAGPVLEWHDSEGLKFRYRFGPRGELMSIRAPRGLGEQAGAPTAGDPLGLGVPKESDHPALEVFPGRVEAALEARFYGSDPEILHELAAFVAMSSVDDLIQQAAFEALKFLAETPEFCPDCLLDGYTVETPLDADGDLEHQIIRRCELEAKR
jgi:hypothetical protein